MKEIAEPLGAGVQKRGMISESGREALHQFAERLFETRPGDSLQYLWLAFPRGLIAATYHGATQHQYEDIDIGPRITEEVARVAKEAQRNRISLADLLEEAESIFCDQNISLRVLARDCVEGDAKDHVL